MSLLRTFFAALHHPVWWEDLIPGALLAAPKVAMRLATLPLLAHGVGAA